MVAYLPWNRWRYEDNKTLHETPIFSHKPKQARLQLLHRVGQRLQEGAPHRKGSRGRQEIQHALQQHARVHACTPGQNVVHCREAA